ncbi:hypothetical protein CEXT_247321 [Caerostris extrusa]|uniref:Uncharacterized protein n=1 Tax=Caerostris extrusa TaxID=172846 RepID=A0AAV4MEE3_CAEEX|nr:hypothetical protein CEXT_247321 [Caerostris extrusa]
MGDFYTPVKHADAKSVFEDKGWGRVEGGIYRLERLVKWELLTTKRLLSIFGIYLKSALFKRRMSIWKRRPTILSKHCDTCDYIF